MVARLLCCHAPHSATLLRRWRPSFHHVQLLSETAVARYSAPPGSVSDRAGAGAAALSVRRRWLRGHARAHSPSARRAANKDSFDGDAGAQTWICAARSGAGETTTQSRASCSFRPRPATHLAKTLLRFQRLDRTQTHRETPLHASQSGAARVGGVSGTMALEQLSRICPRRSRSGKSKRVGGAQDEDPTASRVAAKPCLASDGAAAHFSKGARSGAPPSYPPPIPAKGRYTWPLEMCATRQ